MYQEYLPRAIIIIKSATRLASGRAFASVTRRMPATAAAACTLYTANSCHVPGRILVIVLGIVLYMCRTRGNYRTRKFRLDGWPIILLSCTSYKTVHTLQLRRGKDQQVSFYPVCVCVYVLSIQHSGSYTHDLCVFMCVLSVQRTQRFSHHDARVCLCVLSVQHTQRFLHHDRLIISSSSAD